MKGAETGDSWKQYGAAVQPSLCWVVFRYYGSKAGVEDEALRELREYSLHGRRELLTA